MTDLSAAGLIGRSAAAYVSGVPEDAADDGLFGPASVAWRVSTDLAWPDGIRQSLGVLDAMFLSQPGVLEARQRITLRMRAGRPA